MKHLISIVFALLLGVGTARANEPPVFSSHIPNQEGLSEDTFQELFNIGDYVYDPEGDPLYFYWEASETDDKTVIQRGNGKEGLVSVNGTPWPFRTDQEGLAFVLVQVSDKDNGDLILNPTDEHRIVELRLALTVGDTTFPNNSPPYAGPLDNMEMPTYSRVTHPLNAGGFYDFTDDVWAAESLVDNHQFLRLSYRVEYSGPTGFKAYMKNRNSVQLETGESTGHRDRHGHCGRPFGVESSSSFAVRIFQEEVQPLDPSDPNHPDYEDPDQEPEPVSNCPDQEGQVADENGVFPNCPLVTMGEMPDLSYRFVPNRWVYIYNLSGYFHDPDGGDITFTAVQREDILNVTDGTIRVGYINELSGRRNGYLLLDFKRRGTTRITVTATDPQDSSITKEQKFNLKLSDEPDSPDNDTGSDALDISNNNPGSGNNTGGGGGSGGGGGRARPMDGKCGVERYTCEVGEPYNERLGEETWEWACRGENRGNNDTCSAQRATSFLEIPPEQSSFQSGIGIISGWVCEAEVVEIEIDGETTLEAAYGTERADTETNCGDTDNGFGLLFNWNLLGDGEHTVVASVDGIELGRAIVTVTTLGEEFVRGAAGTCEVEDFPRPGERVRLMWQQSSQNFVLADGAVPAGENQPGRAGVGYLENPGPHSFQSGIGVLSGWVCEADTVEVGPLDSSGGR